MKKIILIIIAVIAIIGVLIGVRALASTTKSSPLTNPSKKNGLRSRTLTSAALILFQTSLLPFKEKQTLKKAPSLKS